MKRAVALLTLLWMIVSLLSLGALAEEVDVNKNASLTLQYRHGEEVFSGLAIQTYRVAQIAPNGEMTLTGAFADYPINIEGIQCQSEWRRIATTLASYIAADGIAYTASGVTDAEGYVHFTNLQPGMYLTLSVRTERERTLTIFETFLTVIPHPMEDDSYLYDVTAYPKCEQKEIVPTEVTYKVVKQWKDGSYTNLRPVGVTVDILKDGVLQRQVILSSENNWSYSWNVPDDGAKWQAVERDVADYYTVSVEEFDKTIVITNLYDHSDLPPQAGDATTPQLYLLVTGAGGCALLLWAVWRKRAGI